MISDDKHSNFIQWFREKSLYYIKERELPPWPHRYRHLQPNFSNLKWKIFLSKHFLPLELERGSWSMDAIDYEIILNQLKKVKKHRKRITIVELGSGVSTIIFGLFLKRHNLNNLLISFEKDENWIKEVDKMIKKYELGNNIELQHASYIQYSNHTWFDKDEIKNALKNHQIDLIVIDAPPGPLCPFSRKPAIPFFLQYLHAESIVILHDTARTDEAETVNSWSSYFKKFEKINTPKGITLFEGKK